MPGRAARVLIVQSRPYQAFAGGDGAYIHALVRHLEGFGCVVRGITSGSTKGRPRPWLRLAYRSTRNPWRFRSTVRLGGVYLSTGAQLVRDSIAFLRERGRAGGGSPFAQPLTAAERRWIERQIDAFDPDLTILCFETVAMASAIGRKGRATLALSGFLPGREYRLAQGGLAQDGSRAVSDYIQHLREAGTVAFSSLDDRDYALRELGIARAIFVGMGVRAQSAQARGNTSDILFVGNKTGPNREAVQWFLDRVWPAVRAHAAEARFRIVGRIGHWFGDDPARGIICVGEVEDLADEYRRARLVVAPLQTGSAGVKTKVVEALSFGCPVVATSLGVDAADHGQMDEAGFITDDPEEFAGHVVELLSDDDIWRAKQAGTAAVFDRLFSEKAAYRQLDELMATQVKDAR